MDESGGDYGSGCVPLLRKNAWVNEYNWDYWLHTDPIHHVTQYVPQPGSSDYVQCFLNFANLVFFFLMYFWNLQILVLNSQFSPLLRLWSCNSCMHFVFKASQMGVYCNIPLESHILFPYQLSLSFSHPFFFLGFKWTPKKIVYLLTY